MSLAWDPDDPAGSVHLDLRVGEFTGEIPAPIIRPPEERPPVTPKRGGTMRIALRKAKANGWRCVYCGILMYDTHAGVDIGYHDLEIRAAPRGGRYPRRDKGRRLTADHVIPRSAGGKTREDNIVAACHRCNTTKGSRSAAEWRMELIRLAHRNARRPGHPQAEAPGRCAARPRTP